MNADEALRKYMSVIDIPLDYSGSIKNDIFIFKTCINTALVAPVSMAVRRLGMLVTGSCCEWVLDL